MNNPWPKERPFADCDCCGKLRKLTRCWYNNMETYACDECRGISEPEYEYEDRENDQDRWEHENETKRC